MRPLPSRNAASWRLRTAVVRCLLGVTLVGVICGVAPGVGGAAVGTSGGRYLAAAEYYGLGNPFNLWSSDMSGAPARFAQMKRDGFNAVALIIPWGEFETGVEPPAFDKTSFDRLNEVVEAAARLGMGVILRLSYEFDSDPDDQMPETRFDALWSDPRVYAAWLDYISKMYQDVKRFTNIREAYISWEDLWEPVDEALAANSAAARLTLAGSTGYQTWLQADSKLSLAQVSSTYGTSFASWTQVPTPASDTPSFRLMFEYEDWALVHRLFLPAQRRFPGLTMESRVDVDPIFNGTTVVGGYSHTAQFDLPDTSVTGIYYSPYMNDPSSSPDETAADAIAAMQTTLSSLSTKTQGQRMFIYELQFGRNGPAVANDPEIIVDQIPTYLNDIAPLLKQYTAGYALWTYQNYQLSWVFNPSFALGGNGWQLAHGAHAEARSSARSFAALPAGAEVTQQFPTGAVGGPGTITVTAEASKPELLHVHLNGDIVTITVKGGWRQYHLPLPATLGSLSSVTLGASGPVDLTNVRIFNGTTDGDVYATNGQPEVGAAAIRKLNQVLAGN